MAGSRRSGEPKTVLVVEDDADLRQVLREALGDDGYEVVTAGDGNEAFDLLSRGPAPDLILLDLLMPGMTGWEVLSRLRRAPELARIPVTVMSGLENADAIEDARFVQKPLNLSLLLRLVREDLALARWRTGR